MEKVLRIIDIINEWVGKIIAYFLVVIIFIVTFEVIMRYGLDNPTIWVNELSQFLFGGYIVLSGGYLLLNKSHVAMDLVYNRWSRRTQAIVDCITFVVVVFFCVAYIWHGGNRAIFSWMTGEHANTIWAPPLYFVKTALPVGGVLLLLQAIAKFIRDINIAIKGDDSIGC